MAMMPRGWVLLAAGVCVACGSGPPPPSATPSPRVTELRRTAGTTIQDCGEGVEARDDHKCRIQPVLECVEAALRSCRPAQGTHLYSTGEGDPVRVDYFVVQKAGGGCEFVVVEDRSRDPLGPGKPTELVCGDAGWQPHPRIRGCDVLAPSACAARGG
jgi:hypothetical protein